MATMKIISMDRGFNRLSNALQYNYNNTVKNQTSILFLKGALQLTLPPIVSILNELFVPKTPSGLCTLLSDALMTAV